MIDLNTAGSDPVPPSHFEMTARQPHLKLAGLVVRLTGYSETLAGHFRHTAAASLSVPLVVSFGEAFSIGLGRRPGKRDRFGSFAAGLYAGPVVINSYGRASCVQIDFTPLGARRFLGLPMNEIAGRMVDLEDALGTEGRMLRERLTNEPGWERRLDMAERFVATRLAVAGSGCERIAWAYDRLAESGGRVAIASIAADVGWSRKHFGQRFAEEVGLGPKAVARIMRFNQALDAARSGTKDCWAGIAADCGYADQAHMVREFREFAGVPPSAFQPSGVSG